MVGIYLYTYDCVGIEVFEAKSAGKTTKGFRQGHTGSPVKNTKGLHGAVINWHGGFYEVFSDFHYLDSQILHKGAFPHLLYEAHIKGLFPNHILQHLEQKVSFDT